MPEQIETRPAAAGKENSREEEKEAPAEPEPSPIQDKEVRKPTARPKKVISRKKAGKQIRAIIVAVRRKRRK